MATLVVGSKWAHGSRKKRGSYTWQMYRKKKLIEINDSRSVGWLFALSMLGGQANEREREREKGEGEKYIIVWTVWMR